MASIQNRNNVWQVRIRIKGFPTLVRSFDSRKAAQVWANEKDNEQLRGIYRDESDAQKTTLAAAGIADTTVSALLAPKG